MAFLRHSRPCELTWVQAYWALSWVCFLVSLPHGLLRPHEIRASPMSVNLTIFANGYGS